MAQGLYMPKVANALHPGPVFLSYVFFMRLAIFCESGRKRTITTLQQRCEEVMEAAGPGPEFLK